MRGGVIVARGGVNIVRGRGMPKMEDSPLPLQHWSELELQETLGSDVGNREGGLRFLRGHKQHFSFAVRF